MNKKINFILVTGGAGFIGRNLCKKLLENNDNKIICIDNLITGNLKNIKEFESNKNFEYINHDINKIIDFPIIDEIYHLACIASPDKYKIHSIETLNTCFIGTKNILELAKKHNAKLLFTSTSEIYGDPTVHPQPEEYFGNVNTMGERSCYDEGKRISETLIYEYRTKFNLNLKVVRLFNTYGPYMDINDGRVITNFIKQIMNKDFLYIYGTGNQTRSFCYIDDMIYGLISMMKSEQLGPINLGNPYCEITLNNLVQVFEKIVGNKLDVKHIKPTENDPKQRKPDISKAKQTLDWTPKVTLEDGLKETITYFKSIGF
jgi:UDP-glucuronate decarboxylase